MHATSGHASTSRPCDAPADPFPQGDGIDGTLQRIALSAINGAACELGTGREELILSLEPRSGFGPEVTWTEDTLEEALRAGLVRAIDDADDRDTIPGIVATGPEGRRRTGRRSTGSSAASTFRSSRTDDRRSGSLVARHALCGFVHR